MWAKGFSRRGKRERHIYGLDRKGTFGRRCRLGHAEARKGSQKLLLVSVHFSCQTGGISARMLDLLFQKHHSMEARGEMAFDAVNPVICWDKN